MSFQPPQPFRFLDLPAEIRNNIYDLLLCSWQDELEIEHGNVSKVSRRCPSYPASSLLRASKQIHGEAFDYMIKRNQFVRITCRGLDVRNLFLEDGIPVVTTNDREVSNFKGYVMHMTLSKPVFRPTSFAFNEYEMMLLHADLPKLCEKLDVETVMSDANTSTNAHASLNANITFAWQHAHFLTPNIQERLLSPIAGLMRGIPNLRISGPVNPALAASVSEIVAKPRWTDPEAILGEIHTGVDVGKRQWQQSDAYSASESWHYAMRTLERMRHSSSWLGLKATGGVDFVNNTADLYFTLNLLCIAFLQFDMVQSEGNAGLVQRNGNICLQRLRKCETASARFAQHADSTWVPSNQQSAKMMYREARCLRLMRNTTSRIKAISLIEQATALAPHEAAFGTEKDLVLAWSAAFEEMQHTLEQQAIEKNQENGSIWSYFVAAVSEIAS